MAHQMGRRELIQLTAGAALASGMHAAGAVKFLSAEEYSVVEELTELIIPADEKSGGAKAAKVAGYIDVRLAQAFLPEERDRWRKGLALVDSLADRMHGTRFLQCTPAQRAAVVEQMSANEPSPQAAEELFFRDLKAMTIQGYYTSKVGIHDDLDYKGNTYQQGEYAGELPAKSVK